MKKLALTLCLAALTTGAFAQGLVTFQNAGFLVSIDGAPIAAPGGTYTFGLFVAPQGTTALNQFQYAGVTATNLAAAGRLNGGGNIPVTGWAAGETRAFMVRGWSTALGPWSPTLAAIFADPLSYSGPNAYIGTSAIAPNGVAGGSTATGSLPSLSMFGGTLGIQSGFSMTLIPVPEPSSFALAGLGAAAMLIFRRRK